MAALFLLLAATASSDSIFFPGLGYGGDMDKVYRYDLKMNTTTVFWGGDGGTVHKVTEDPTHRRLAFMHMAFLDDRVAASVRILSREGCQEASLGEGVSFSWSPDGSRIAYIKMDYHTEIEPIATEISIYDCVTRRDMSIRKAGTDTTVGEVLYWSKIDGCIYVQKSDPPAVERYSEDDHQWHTTRLRSIALTADEEYVFDYELEVGKCLVWETGNMTDPDGAPTFAIDARGKWLFRWISHRLLSFCDTSRDHAYAVDVHSGEMWAVDGWILAVLEGNCLLWKTPSGEIKRTALSELQQASLEDILVCKEERP